MGHRREQLASVLHRAVQDVITRGLNDPRVRGMITVTGVEVSGDLRDAVVNVSVLPAQYQSATMHGLSAATLRIQRAVNAQLNARRPPHLRFQLDERLKKQAELLGAIREAIGPVDEPIHEQADQQTDERAGDSSAAPPNAPDDPADNTHGGAES